MHEKQLRKKNAISIYLVLDRGVAFVHTTPELVVFTATRLETGIRFSRNSSELISFNSIIRLV